MRILFILSTLILILFACNQPGNNGSNEKSQINSLFAPGDTINFEKSVNGDTEIVLYKENGDTVHLLYGEEIKTFTYVVPKLDTIVKRKVTSTPTTPPTTEPPPPSTGTRQNVIFEALFNGSNPFPTSSLYKQACCSYSVTQSKSTVREGDGSFRAESRPGEPSVSGGYRPEFIPPTNTRLVDGWYGYSVYMQDWKACSSCGEHIMQWHPDNGSGSAVLAIYTERNTFHIRLNPEGDASAFTVKDGMQITPNKWTDFIWHVIWSADKSKGRIELWIDGSKYVDYTGATLTSGGTPYFKIGINRWNIRENRVLYIDAVRIGNEKATYKDVAP